MHVSIIGDGGWVPPWGWCCTATVTRSRCGVRLPIISMKCGAPVRTVNFCRSGAAPDLIWTADRAQAVAGAEVVVLAMPSRFYKQVLASFAPLIQGAPALVSVSKGLDKETHRRLTEVAEEVLGRGPVAALSGPSHAEEVARGIPTAVAIACRDHGVAAALQQVFNNPTFRIYTTDDVVGVELGGALKNVIAVAAASAMASGLAITPRRL
jgi:glycerol-3-phosphate dehydrogenase